MIVAVCVDDHLGMQFNRRRQSKDAALRAKLLELSGGTLRMSGYSAKQFDCPVYAGEDYLSGAQSGEFCFCENTDYLEFAGRIEKLLLFRWNRVYPADVHFTFPGEWRMTAAEEFPGSSHETITMEVYEP